jgi:enterochelin esterase-like enzyme
VSPRPLRRPPLGLVATLPLLALTACTGGSDDGTPTGTAGSTAAAVVASGAASLQPGTNVWTAPDGTEVTFEVVVPPDRVLGQSGRVLVAFPPGGQDVDLTRRIVDDDWRDEAIARDVVVVSPAAPATGLWFTDATAALVDDFLTYVGSAYPPADGRFDLAGVSNGGLSAFRAAVEHPTRFRSMVLFPGAPPSDVTDDELAALAGLDITMFVGGDDTSWLDQSRRAHDRLSALGIDSDLEVIAGEGHIIESLTPARLWDALGT